MVWADAAIDPDMELTLRREDKEFLQVTPSHLRVGGRYRVGDLFYSTLLASDNRASVLLVRSTGLPMEAFVAAMNHRARALKLDSLEFVDPTGISEGNKATARDAARLLSAAARHPVIGPAMLVKEHRFPRLDRAVTVGARLTNKLAHMNHWRVGGAKTGFTNRAGYCLVLRTEIAGRNLVVALLGGRSAKTRYNDSAQLRTWLEAAAAASRPPDGENSAAGG
jgi:D-alanyl-D-alanine endopeptidase (penicillin-binding protein 7)